MIETICVTIFGIAVLIYLAYIITYDNKHDFRRQKKCDVKLQCKIGDIVYAGKNRYEVNKIIIENDEVIFFTKDENGEAGYAFCPCDIGKTVFIKK